MQPKTAIAFPRRAKRFQSYSMTPADSQLGMESQSQNNALLNSNKFIRAGFNRKTINLPSQNGANVVTNQFSYKAMGKTSDSNSLIFQKSEKSQAQNMYSELTEEQCNSYDSFQQNDSKMASSEIFNFSSINERKSQVGSNTMKNSMFVQNNTGLRNFDPSRINNINSSNLIRDKPTRIPSFLLNKKKKDRNQQFQGNSALKLGQLEQDGPKFRFQMQKKKSFKKQKLLDSTKSIQMEGQYSLFSPPSSTKISFSKATTSTLSTNLQRQESRGTFKDFQQIWQLKEIQNSIEDSDNPNNLDNQFENLFKKDQSPTKQLNMLQSEIGQLFSDQDDQSEQFNEDLKHQLEHLF